MISWKLMVWVYLLRVYVYISGCIKILFGTRQSKIQVMMSRPKSGKPHKVELEEITLCNDRILGMVLRDPPTFSYDYVVQECAKYGRTIKIGYLCDTVQHGPCSVVRINDRFALTVLPVNHSDIVGLQ